MASMRDSMVAGADPLQGHRAPGEKLGLGVAKCIMGLSYFGEDRYRVYSISLGVWEGGIIASGS